MPTPQKLTENRRKLARTRPTSTGRQPASAGLAHLVGMEPINRRESTEPALSIKELAAHLCIPVQTLYDLRSQGRGPTGFRVGRRLRFRQSEIDAWLRRMEEEDLERQRAGSRR